MANKEPVGVDILSVALSSGKFSDEDLVDQLMTFLAAGHDTTASALTWAIYILSRYPNVQDRLRQEVRARLPAIDSETAVASVDIDRMPYLNAVCNEVLRTYSPVAQTVRDAARDTTIQGIPSAAERASSSLRGPPTWTRRPGHRRERVQARALAVRRPWRHQLGQEGGQRRGEQQLCVPDVPAWATQLHRAELRKGGACVLACRLDREVLL